MDTASYNHLCNMLLGECPSSNMHCKHMCIMHPSSDPLRHTPPGLLFLTNRVI